MPLVDVVPAGALLALLATAYAHPSARVELAAGLTAAGVVLATGILGPAEVEEALRRLGPAPAFLVTILVVADVCAHPGCCHLTQLRSRSSADTRRCAMIRP